MIKVVALCAFSGRYSSYHKSLLKGYRSYTASEEVWALGSKGYPVVPGSSRKLHGYQHLFVCSLQHTSLASRPTLVDPEFLKPDLGS